MPKSGKGKIKAFAKYLVSKDSLSNAMRKARAIEFEKHTQRYCEHKHGKKHTHPQRVSKTTRKRIDVEVDE